MGKNAEVLKFRDLIHNCKTYLYKINMRFWKRCLFLHSFKVLKFYYRKNGYLMYGILLIKTK